MTEFAFLSPRLAETAYRSPLARAPGGERLRDLSATGKVEVRGEVGPVEGAEVVQITPRRALVLCDGPATLGLLRRLRDGHAYVVDVTAAYAGLALEGVQVVRRLTDLDLDDLPAVGAIAGVPALLLRDGDEFRLFFPQEYADHVARVVLDALEGVA